MSRIVLSLLVLSSAQMLAAQTFSPDVTSLIDSSCIDCHDAATETELNLENLDDDLSDPEIFRQWERIFDRVKRGEMPPEGEPRPHEEQLAGAMAFLESELRQMNLTAQQTHGRVPSRRLTRLEYEYTLHDLLGIGGELAKHLPPENVSSTFDTVAVDQGMSLVHIRSYLAAADIALDETIQLGPPPRSQPQEIRYQTSPYTTMWFDRPLRRGGSTVKLVDDAWVTFETRPHVAQSNHMGYHPSYPGLYRITAEAYGYQAKTPVTMLLNRSSDQQGTVQLIAAFDLPPGQSRTVEVTSYFTPEDYFFPAPSDHDWQPDGRNVYATGAKQYKGEGLAVKWLKIEGPLEQQWPPERTRRIFAGVKFHQRRAHWGQQAYQLELTKEPREHVAEIIQRLGPRAFRRPLRKGEAEGFLRLAQPLLDQGQPLEQVVRVPLRAMLSSPQILFHSGRPGALDDHALATRLSYFLWKSLPDDELGRLAEQQKLRDPEVLGRQVDRMLDDEKSNRFVNDFLDQWLGLNQINATTPDEKLYPEYDDNLRQAMLQETRAFFRELIDQNLSVGNLIDSEFTFLNRRLAEHYELEFSPDDPTEHFRRVTLPEGSVRGGLLTQASILKVTANGTVTSPVRRGNFVLANLLGTPPSPPPPNVSSIEPDTRGTTTIRETLDAHRNVAACANCHKHIDPPGFALESFDPIGGFRRRYRSTGVGDWSNRKLFGRSVYEYRLGPAVDASGVTADGDSFRGFREFRQHLLPQTDQVARNLTSQLAVYATGGEIQFADRAEIDRIIQQTSGEHYPVRTMIHKIVQSRLFRNK